MNKIKTISRQNQTQQKYSPKAQRLLRILMAFWITVMILFPFAIFLRTENKGVLCSLVFLTMPIFFLFRDKELFYLHARSEKKQGAGFHFFSFKWLLYALILFSLTTSLAYFYFLWPSKSTYLLVPHINQTYATSYPDTSPDTSSATLIPVGTPPVFYDTLRNKNDPYQWEMGSNSNRGATCFFVQGSSYHIVAPAESLGGECSPKAPNTTFTNFVYQIKMVINQGRSAGLRAGPFFCGNSEILGGSFYRVNFDSQGDWDFTLLTGGITGPVNSITILAGKSQSFWTGIGQVNYITVQVTKDGVDVQVNATRLFHSDDKQLSGGQIGVSLYPGIENADVAFNDAQVWQL